jgi:SAM-dependent methyltransferase
MTTAGPADPAAPPEPIAAPPGSSSGPHAAGSYRHPAPVRDPASYRDPSGFVFWRDGQPYRQIERRFAASWDAFESSPLSRILMERGWLVRHEAAPVELAQGTTAHRVIRPERIDFVSYPYEWTFGQLRDAALLTLDIQGLALEHGFTLRDASAYNIQFREGRPIHIDTLSFEPTEPGRPWIAYRQFCEHFLAPLTLMAKRDVRLAALLRDNLDGVPLDLASRLLPGSSRLNLGLATHVHLHARAQRRYADRPREAQQRVRSARPVNQAALLDSLRRTIAGLRWAPAGTEWADYDDRTSYSADATADKEALVARFIAATEGRRVWDLGANTGHYSRIAADAGRQVIAFDIDPAAAERHYRTVRADGRTDILPLVMDLANPSPALGWAGAERRSLAERADADSLLALALVHHLAIGRNVPLGEIGRWFARLGRQLVIEFVPKEDQMAQRLLATREDVFDDYSIEGFRAAFGESWTIIDEAPIRGTRRVLFSLRRRDA